MRKNAEKVYNLHKKRTFFCAQHSKKMKEWIKALTFWAECCIFIMKAIAICDGDSIKRDIVELKVCEWFQLKTLRMPVDVLRQP